MVSELNSAVGQGPLSGIRVVEIAGIGPGPHACMILADLGADVVRVERPGGTMLAPGVHEILTRGRQRVGLDLKTPQGREKLLALIDRADVLVEGMRPGAAERLGVGPEKCLLRNPGLVYGRITGWGQEGPYMEEAGHDLNYLAVSGILDRLGQDPTRPHFPLNLLGDFGGGSTYLVIGILAALQERGKSGKGQVVDANIVDGITNLAAGVIGLHSTGRLDERRGAGLLDGGAHFYDLYETSDGRHMAVAAIEPKFYDELLGLLGFDGVAVRTSNYDAVDESSMRELFIATFASKTQAEWVTLFAGTDACVMPVLSIDEAVDDDHLRARGSYAVHNGILQPGVAPRFSRTPGAIGVNGVYDSPESVDLDMIGWSVREP